jgi:hypothetical protein
MDDRLAKLLLEDNILSIQKRDSARISLLEKLATIKSVDLQTLPVPGTTPGATFQKIFVEDDFISAIQIATFINPGILAWFPFNLVADMVNTSVFSTSHPGIASLDVAAGVVNWLIIPPLPSVNSFDALRFIMRLDAPLNAGDVYRIGILSTLIIATEGIYFQYTFGDANWKTVTDDGGGQTLNDAGVAFNAANWVLFEIRRKTLNVFEFYINQILVATHSANISTSNIQYPIMYADNTGGTNFKFYVDYFSIEMATTVQRWT